MLDMLDRTLPTAFAGNAGLAERARHAALRIAVRSGDAERVVVFDRGRLTVQADGRGGSDISLGTSPENWAQYAMAVPPVGYQSLNGMMRAGHLTASGDMLAFARHLLLIEQVFAAVRPAAEEPAAAPKPVGKPWIEGVTGRYLHLDIAGRPHRVYFEEAGPADGIPLLCLHTAGSDGRQYRAVLNDREVTERYRVIAFDLPRHGKSSPPVGYEREHYQLTTALYVETVMAVAAALALDRPVVMGCSIGGRAVLHLALAHPTAFRAAIGLQSALTADPGRDAVLRDLGIIWRPDVHGGDAAAATVACLIAPTAPSADRWETLWHYSQSGPGVFSGDLHYYGTDGNLAAADVAPLKGGSCPVYLLTGEYDLSATPALTAELGNIIEARRFEVMKGLGHFPMSENPAVFLDYLRPVLAEFV